MTKTYALKRLLEHGPMTPFDIQDCTRWTCKQVHSAINSLLESDLIRYIKEGSTVYYEAI